MNARVSSGRIFLFRRIDVWPGIEDHRADPAARRSDRSGRIWRSQTNPFEPHGFCFVIRGRIHRRFEFIQLFSIIFKVRPCS